MTIVLNEPDKTKQKVIVNNLKGQEIIKFIAKTLPSQPGVYQMEDEDGKILSTNLRGSFLERKIEEILGNQ